MNGLTVKLEHNKIDTQQEGAIMNGLPILPQGWSSESWWTASAGELTVDVENGTVTVEWEESCDDHYGRTTRSASFPLKVITVLMKRQEYLTDKLEHDKIDTLITPTSFTKPYLSSTYTRYSLRNNLI